ncbi:uncharacterized protein HD556DRAFT_1442603 [Suillus plorans]|uniref:Uncharacterized protein n=1 Tax=Suillus plorans TaxID=116603 RepID=A0A9P7AR85_9AGAM|nr:uncharacterized protein HD556DRAFT_1442603 [Suillus plorans]KAG1794821.1 hypothetical protein HD556DRAFT_1442603 [Suillus plorans]
MAAATHTDAQARIQEELDNVVGRRVRGDLKFFTFGFGRCQTYMDYLNEKAAMCNLLIGYLSDTLHQRSSYSMGLLPFGESCSED